MSSTSDPDFEEHSEATHDKINSETHEDTDLMAMGQENRIQTVHLSSASGPEESVHSINGKYKSENLLVADKMNVCGSAVNHFISADDPAETANKDIKREMVEDSDEISMEQKYEINILQHSPATNPEESYENRNQSMCMQQQFVIPTSNMKGSNTHLEGVTESFLHMDTLHKNDRYMCKVCDKYFSSAYNLKIHIRVHTGDKPYECNVCGKSFTTNSQLTVHNRRHTGNKPYKCKVCRKSFTTKGDLTARNKIHTGEKPYECKVCGKSFTTIYELTIHNRWHTGDKPYECKVCGKSFTSKSDLTTHNRTHTGDKPYECKVCGKSFSQKSHLTRHYRTHTGERPHKCQVCGKS